MDTGDSMKSVCTTSEGTFRVGVGVALFLLLVGLWYTYDTVSTLQTQLDELRQEVASGPTTIVRQVGEIPVDTTESDMYVDEVVVPPWVLEMEKNGPPSISPTGQ